MLLGYRSGGARLPGNGSEGGPRLPNLSLASINHGAVSEPGSGAALTAGRKCGWGARSARQKGFLGYADHTVSGFQGFRAGNHASHGAGVRESLPTARAEA